jgi:hypothetical protein
MHVLGVVYTSEIFLKLEQPRVRQMGD